MIIEIAASHNAGLVIPVGEDRRRADAGFETDIGKPGEADGGGDALAVKADASTCEQGSLHFVILWFKCFTATLNSISPT